MDSKEGRPRGPSGPQPRPGSMKGREGGEMGVILTRPPWGDGHRTRAVPTEDEEADLSWLAASTGGCCQWNWVFQKDLLKS